VDLAIADRVIFHGFTARAGEQIARLDALVMPSWHEGLPYVLLEAMSLEVPIVATRVGGLAEVLDGRECALLVPPRDPAALASALERLYHDPALARRLSRSARALVTGEFEAGRMVTRYADLYKELLAAS